MLISNKPFISKQEMSKFIFEQKQNALFSVKDYFLHGGSYEDYNKIVGFYECLNLISKKFDISIDNDVNL